MSDRIAVVTDSIADIPSAIAKELDITVIPIHVHVGEKCYWDSELSPDEFYAILTHRQEVPKTAAPAPGVFAEAYLQLAKRAEHVLAIHVASRLSALYNAALLGAQMLSDVDIEVMDSESLTMGMGLLVIAAARAARQGYSFPEVIALVRDLVPRIRVVACVDDLYFLARSGRVSWVTSLVGTIFQIKPVILIQRGDPLLKGRARTMQRGLDHLMDLIHSFGPLQEVSVIHTNAPETAEILADKMTAVYPRERIIMARADVGIGSHTGPGAVGVACILAPSEQVEQR